MDAAEALITCCVTSKERWKAVRRVRLHLAYDERESLRQQHQMRAALLGQDRLLLNKERSFSKRGDDWGKGGVQL